MIPLSGKHSIKQYTKELRVLELPVYRRVRVDRDRTQGLLYIKLVFYHRATTLSC